MSQPSGGKLLFKTESLNCFIYAIHVKVLAIIATMSQPSGGSRFASSHAYGNVNPKWSRDCGSDLTGDIANIIFPNFTGGIMKVIVTD
ncbi:hypothetical protein Tsubulata_002710 [Turnera subulata]|uniref:Uncharacterized protein n=1 Tax=Turnera subulata TaxID=218843 RepID=A0A9Q0GCC5_9ROSI|nr:hypothetical protein Tsubulata_002710 [Turnera subulata]